MASDYAIRLKATLDTSEVQREIQKLKSVQRGGSGRDDSRQGGGPGGGNNLGNLGSTLTKLKGSLDALRKSVDSLATLQRQSFQATRNPRTEAQMAILMGGLGGTRGGFALGGSDGMDMLNIARLRGQNEANWKLLSQATRKDPNLGKAIRPIVRKNINATARQLQKFKRYTLNPEDFDEADESIPQPLTRAGSQPIQWWRWDNNVRMRRVTWAEQMGAGGWRDRLAAGYHSGPGGVWSAETMSGIRGFAGNAWSNIRGFAGNAWSNIRGIPGWADHRLRGMRVWAVRQFAHPFRSDEEGGKGYFYRSPWDQMSEDKRRKAQRAAMRRSMGLWLGGMYFGDSLSNTGRVISQNSDLDSRGMQYLGLGLQAGGAGINSGMQMASLAAHVGLGSGAQAFYGSFAGIASAATTVVQHFTQLAQAAAETAVAIEKNKFAVNEQGRQLQRQTVSLGEGYAAGVIAETARRRYTNYEQDNFVLSQTEMYDRRRGDALGRLRLMEDPLRYAQNRRNAAESMIGAGRLNTEGGIFAAYDSQEINRIREEAEEDIKIYLQRYKDMQDQFRQLDNLYQTWRGALDEIERSNMVIHENFMSDYNQFEDEEMSRVAANFAAMREAEEVTGLGWFRRGQRNALQGIANNILYDRKNSPRSQFNQLSELLTSYRNQRNEALNSAYSLNKQILAGGLDEIELGELQKRRSQEQERANHLGDLAQILEAALQKIDTHVMKPDMHNVQSLGQYGMFFNERDNRTEIYKSYLQRQVNLQTEIRDKLNEGVSTEARYN